MSLIVFNSLRSTAEEQFELLSKLPLSHQFGDLKTTFIIDSHEKVMNREECDLFVDPELRVKTRKRCTLVPVLATHLGNGYNRKQLSEPLEVLTCFLAMSDWQAQKLDVERFFLLDVDKGPKIGSYFFDFAAFAFSVYEDMAMCFDAIKDTVLTSKTKCHLKILPMGVGPTIKSRKNDFLGPYVLPVYLVALQFACNACLDDSWVDTVEFVDHTHGYMTPIVDLKRVRVISNLNRDAFDFTPCPGSQKMPMPVVLLPSDAFCVLGGRDRNLATTLANNSNLRSIDLSKSSFVKWPFRSSNDL